MSDLVTEIAMTGSAMIGFLAGVVFWQYVCYAIFDK